MSIAISLHILAVIIWVGGMFFAHQVLRPVAASQLEPPQRLALWVGVFSRFFPWVWLSVAVILVSGLWVIFAVFGGMGSSAMHVHLMLAIGLVMMGIYAYVYFVPFGGLKQAVAEQAWPVGAEHLARIRQLVGINLLLGLLTSVIAAGGRYF